MIVLTNFMVFQVGWFACVIGAANGLPWVGPIVVAAALALHLRIAMRPQPEAMLVVACGLSGLVFDSLLVVQGWVAYPSGMVSAFFAPYWIVAMWMLFATTLNVSMAWLKDRWILASVLGAIFGPASYLAGERLGGIEFISPEPALLALGAGWALMLPALLALADRLDGFSVPVAVEVESQ